MLTAAGPQLSLSGKAFSGRSCLTCGYAFFLRAVHIWKLVNMGIQRPTPFLQFGTVAEGPPQLHRAVGLSEASAVATCPLQSSAQSLCSCALMGGDPSVLMTPSQICFWGS